MNMPASSTARRPTPQAKNSATSIFAINKWGVLLLSLSGLAACGQGGRLIDTDGFEVRDTVGAELGESGKVHEWRGEAAMVSNFGWVRSGEFIYQDYLYDDHGPNADKISHTDAPLGAAVRGGDPTNPRTGSSGGQVRHAGDYFYAADDSGYYLNVADLIEFRATRRGEDVYYLFRMAALAAEDDAVIGVCIDTDGRMETGLVDWPFEAGLSQALGCDLHLTVHGTGTQVTDASGTITSLKELGGATRADVEANTIEVRVPVAVADPGAGTWRYWVASGVWDAAAGTWLQVLPSPSNPGSPIATGGGIGVPMIWDLLSNNFEPNTYWREERQADDLARNDISKHFVDVDFGRLANGVDDPEPELTGVIDRIYIAEHSMEPNEGVRFQAVSLGPRNYIYYGDYQPYAVVIPETYYQQLEQDPATTLPFDLCLHPLNGNHHVEIYYAEVEAQRNYVAGVTGTTEHTGYLGFSAYEGQINRQNLIYACVVGRGEAVGFTGGNGMVDALEVMREVRKHYRTDIDQTTVHGISLGAIGSWYMSTLYPDMFSAVLPSIFTGSTGHLTNLYNLPAFYTIGTFDQFAQGVTAGDNVADSMIELGNEFLYYRHLLRFHELSLGNEGNPFAEPLFYSRRRVENPARVRFIHDAGRYSEKIPDDGGAYWVEAMASREDGESTIDVTSLGRADELPADQVVFDGLYENTREGYQARMRGLLRMNPEEFAEAWQPEQFQEGWRELDLQVTHTELEREPVQNAFRLSSTNLGSAALNVDRMRLDPTSAITAIVQGDGELELTLRGAFPASVEVTLDGQAVASSISQDGLVVVLPLSGEDQDLLID